MAQAAKNISGQITHHPQFGYPPFANSAKSGALTESTFSGKGEPTADKTA
jgi:hypothetical protein